MRASGILLPVSSLPSGYGIGAFDRSAFDFVDTLVSAGQRYWQILPMGPTGFGDSPYQSFSTFAGNPYYIALDELVPKGYLANRDLEQSGLWDDGKYVNYESLYKKRFPLLRRAYKNSGIRDDKKFLEFVEANEDWLPDYALFMAVKDSKGGQSFLEWEEELKRRKPETLARYQDEYEEDV